MKKLLDAEGATGSAFDWEGGLGSFVAWSDNFEGATVTLEMSPDGGTTFVTVEDIAGDAVSLTANGERQFKLASGVKIRAAVSSAGSPTPSLNARAFSA